MTTEEKPRSLDTGVDAEAAAVLARSGRTAELMALLSDTVDVVDHKGDSLLMLAAYHGHVDTVVALLTRGADGTARSARGLSAVDGAAFKGDAAVIEAFIAARADLDAAGPDGRTPLMWAAAFNRVGTIERLLEHGVNATAKDDAGRTALDHAEAMGAADAVALLRRS